MINSEQKWRRKYIGYGLRESRKRLDVSLEERYSLPINATLSEVVFWMMAADEWHIKNRNENNSYVERKKADIEGKYLLGFKHVFNSLKHNMSFIKLIRPKEGKELFEGSDIYVEDYTSELIWINTEGINEGRQSQINNYEKFLSGKEVLVTIDSAILFLDKLECEMINEL